MPSDPVAWVRDFAAQHELVVLESSLVTLPGCTHWHLRKAGSSGTLELTWWPRTEEFWASVHANRHADWMEPLLAQLRAD